MSVRLTPDEHERARLHARKAGAPSVSAYIRAKLLADADTPTELPASPRDRQVMLAELLVRLGRSNALANLTALAEAAKIGTLPTTPDVIADIREGISLLAEIRRTLLTFLGTRAPERETE